MRAQRQPVHRAVARATRPRDVSATVAPAGDVADGHLAAVEPVFAAAVRRGHDYPAAAAVLDEVTDCGLSHERNGRPVAYPRGGRAGYVTRESRGSRLLLNGE